MANRSASLTARASLNAAASRAYERLAAARRTYRAVGEHHTRGCTVDSSQFAPICNATVASNNEPSLNTSYGQQQVLFYQHRVLAMPADLTWS